MRNSFRWDVCFINKSVRANESQEGSCNVVEVVMLMFSGLHWIVHAFFTLSLYWFAINYACKQSASSCSGSVLSITLWWGKHRKMAVSSLKCHVKTHKTIKIIRLIFIYKLLVKLKQNPPKKKVATRRDRHKSLSLFSSVGQERCRTENPDRPATD